VKITGKPFAIDTNVIVRYLVRDDETLYAKAAATFEAMDKGEVTLFCDPIILGEVVWVLLSVYKVSRERIAQDLESLLAADGLVMQDKARYAQALRLFAGPIPHFGDACACAAAMEECDGNLQSFDRKLSRVDGVTRLESV
jgi:predicted nucleic-acid-binding protein